MIDQDLIRNFVNQYRKPFRAQTIAEITGIEIKVIRSAIRTLLADNEIKFISKQDKLYVSSKRYQSQVGFQQKGNWKYSTQVAEEILNLLDNKQFHSNREIANAYGKSRQLVFVYLEAMASIGMVGINSSGYFVITRERILKLGTSIHSGILGKQRKESGLKPKPRIKKAAG
jgi:predicted transcriptional regulator